MINFPPPSNPSLPNPEPSSHIHTSQSRLPTPHTPQPHHKVGVNYVCELCGYKSTHLQPRPQQQHPPQQPLPSLLTTLGSNTLQHSIGLAKQQITILESQNKQKDNTIAVLKKTVLSLQEEISLNARKLLQPYSCNQLSRSVIKVKVK